jgi:hypothetical protein
MMLISSFLFPSVLASGYKVLDGPMIRILLLLFGVASFYRVESLVFKLFSIYSL